MCLRSAVSAPSVLATLLVACCITGVAHATNATIIREGEWELLLLAEPLPWQAAEHLCAKYGGHLVSVSNQTEEAVVEQCCFEQLGAIKCWIGLNDILDEGHFVFSDDTPLTYTAWYKAPWSRKWESEPNDALKVWAQEDCVLVERDRRGWHDEHCNDPHPFICRRPAPPPPSPAPAASHQAAAQPATGNVTLQEPPTPEQVAAAAAAAAKRSSSSHLLLWALLGGVVGGLLAFEAVYLIVLFYRKHSGSWSGWRPTFDAVRVVKQVEMMPAADEDDEEFGVPDLVEAPHTWRELAGMRMRAGWARVQGLFRGRRYSELPE